MRPGDALNNMIVTLNFRRPEKYDYRSRILWVVIIWKHNFFTGLPDEGEPLWIINVSVWLLNTSWWKSICWAFCTGRNFLRTSISFILEVAVCSFSHRLPFHFLPPIILLKRRHAFLEVKTLKLSRLSVVQQHLQWLEQSEGFFLFFFLRIWN